MEQLRTWELIFSKVTGDEFSKLIFDFGQLPRDNAPINYSLRVTSTRNTLTRWISLNPKEMMWLLGTLYIEAGGIRFQNRWIKISRFTSAGTNIVKITQTRENRTSSITFPVTSIDCFYKTLVQVENILRIMDEGIEYLPNPTPFTWMEIVAALVLFYHIKMKKAMLTSQEQEKEDIYQTLLDEMLMLPLEVTDHILAFYHFFKFDTSIPFTPADLARSAHSLSAITNGEYKDMDVHDSTNIFPEIIKIMMDVKVSISRPNWAFPNK